MLSINIRLELSDDPVLGKERINETAPWFKGIKYWMSRSMIGLSQEGNSDLSATFEVGRKKFTGCVGHLLRCLFTIALENENSESKTGIGKVLKVATFRKALVEKTAKPIVPQVSDESIYLTKMFPIVWKGKNGTYSLSEEAGSTPVNSVALLLQPSVEESCVVVTAENEAVFTSNVEVFLNGEKLEAERIREILRHYDIRCAMDGDGSSGDGSSGEIEDPEVLIINGPSGDLIVSTDFVGRDWVFQEVDRFIQTESSGHVGSKSGYFCVMGPPGIGKSAICRQFAATRNLPFVSFTNGKTVDDFFAELRQQSEEKFAIPNLPISRGSLAEPSFVQRLMEAIVKDGRRESPLIFVIDGLDEAPKELISRLPSNLPSGVFILASSRGTNESKCPLLNAVNNVKPLVIRPEDPRNEADIDAYLAAQKDDFFVTRFAAETESSPQRLLAEIKLKSEGNFMFIHYVLFDLRHENRMYRTLQEIPVGLEGYYKFHVERLQKCDGSEEDWFKVRLPILTVLMLAKAPYPSEVIQEFASVPLLGDLSALKLNAALNAIGQFLIEERVEMSDGSDLPGYRIYHADFRQYLNERAELADGKGIKDAVSSSMSRKLMQAFMTNSY